MSTRRTPILFWIVLILVGVLLLAVNQQLRTPPRTTYSLFLQQVQSGQVLSATINAAPAGVSPVDYSLKNGAHFETVLPHDYRDALDAMQQRLVNVEIRPAAQWPRFIANSAPFLILLGFWFFAYSRLKNRGA